MAAKIIKSTSLLSFKFVLIPLASLVAVVGVGAFAYNFSKDRINQQLVDIKRVEAEVSTLSTKVSILQEEKDLLVIYEPQASTILPNENPILYQLFLLKQLAQDYSITLDDLKIGGQGSTSEGELLSINVGFTSSGTTDDVLNFIDALQGQAPMFALQKVQLETQDDSSTAEVSALSYYSSLPESLPPATSAITRISRDELEAFTSYNTSSAQPGFSLTPQRGNETRNPFVF